MCLFTEPKKNPDQNVLVCSHIQIRIPEVMFQSCSYMQEKSGIRKTHSIILYFYNIFLFPLSNGITFTTSHIYVHLFIYRERNPDQNTQIFKMFSHILIKKIWVKKPGYFGSVQISFKKNHVKNPRYIGSVHIRQQTNKKIKINGIKIPTYLGVCSGLIKIP